MYEERILILMYIGLLVGDYKNLNISLEVVLTMVYIIQLNPWIGNLMINYYLNITNGLEMYTNYNVNITDSVCNVISICLNTNGNIAGLKGIYNGVSNYNAYWVSQLNDNDLASGYIRFISWLGNNNDTYIMI